LTIEEGLVESSKPKETRRRRKRRRRRRRRRDVVGFCRDKDRDLAKEIEFLAELVCSYSVDDDLIHRVPAFHLIRYRFCAMFEIRKRGKEKEREREETLCWILHCFR